MAQDNATSASEPPTPPSPPPLPPQPPLPSNKRAIRTSTGASHFIHKLQAAPHGYWFESGEPAVEVDTINPTGWYFFYGTLMEPSFLAEVLKLDEQPVLRPAKIVGYSLKLWGQYPALVDGERGQEVHGMAWQVEEKQRVVRLGEYETRAYRSAPCIIYFTDKDDKDDKEYGYSFKYCGMEMDLRDGEFDLQGWLKSIGRINW